MHRRGLGRCRVVRLSPSCLFAADPGPKILRARLPAPAQSVLRPSSTLMLRRACQASASATRALVGFRHEFAPTAQRAAASALLARNEAADANGAQEGAAWRTGAGLLAVSAAAAALLTNRSECEASPNAKEEQQAGGVSLISPEKRKMVFFNYERSLRQRSSPDKVLERSQFTARTPPLHVGTAHGLRHTFMPVEMLAPSSSFPVTAVVSASSFQIFEYFSSEVRNGCAYMTPVDLMRAVVPVFQPFGASAWPLFETHVAAGSDRPPMNSNDARLISLVGRAHQTCAHPTTTLSLAPAERDEAPPGL